MLPSATTRVYKGYNPSFSLFARFRALSYSSTYRNLASRAMAGQSANGTSNAGSAEPSVSGIPSVSSTIDFLHLVENLKKQPRTGWVYRDVQNPESIADHMYRMAILAMTVAGTQYDNNKLVKMAIVHDLAEAIVGDITPVDGVSDEDKYERESAAIKKIQTMLGTETVVAQEVAELWAQYEEGKTDEAKLCKDFDKIEMILQAFEYESSQGKELQEFFDSTAGKWRTSLGEQLAKEVIRRREDAVASKS